MRKLAILLALVVLGSCTCEIMIAQIPPQTVKAGPGCEAPLPDFTLIVEATDNCPGTLIKQQMPAPGTILSIANPSVTVAITARDAFGNVSDTMFVPVILIDSVKPILNWPAGQANMTELDAVLLYENWEAAVKVYGIAHWIYDQRWTQGMPFADTTRIMESLHYFTNTIELTDEEYAQYVALMENK